MPTPKEWMLIILKVEQEKELLKLQAIEQQQLIKAIDPTWVKVTGLKFEFSEIADE